MLPFSEEGDYTYGIPIINCDRFYIGSVNGYGAGGIHFISILGLRRLALAIILPLPSFMTAISVR